MSKEQMERDFRKLFAERVAKVCHDIEGLCDAAELDYRTSSAIIVEGCLSLAAAVVAANSSMPSAVFLEMCEHLYNQTQETKWRMKNATD